MCISWNQKCNFSNSIILCISEGYFFLCLSLSFFSDNTIAVKANIWGYMSKLFSCQLLLCFWHFGIFYIDSLIYCTHEKYSIIRWVKDQCLFPISGFWWYGRVEGSWYNAIVWLKASVKQKKQLVEWKQNGKKIASYSVDRTNI